MDNILNSKTPEKSRTSKSPSLYIVFKYVAIGSGIIGIGFLIALISLFLTSK